MEEQNPWWRGRDYIEEDPHIRRWREARIKWVPREINEVSLEPFSLNFVYGPRQVGKTTMIKLLIRELLSKVRPESVFYCNCDIVTDHEELLNLIREYLRMRRGLGIKTSYIFLDEVVFVNEWYRAIKHLIDSGEVTNDVVTVTGSSSLSVLRQLETFPGRRGLGRDVRMLPLDFPSFVRVMNPNIEVKPGFYEEIRDYLRIYLTTGGFPLPINSYPSIGFDVYKTYIDWIIYDIRRANRSEDIGKEVLSAVLSRVGSRVSYNSIARELGLSHTTVSEYVKMFSDMFLLLILNFVDPNTGHKIYRKEVKIYITDPFLYDVVSRWTGVKRPDESLIIEGVVASHLARTHDVGYTVIGKQEIDVVTLPDMVGYEVKYSEAPRPVRVIGGKVKRVLTLGKGDGEGVVPVHLFLAGLHE